MAVDFEIRRLREAVVAGRIHWHAHALTRFLERGISRGEILAAVMRGEVVETYPEDRPFPSCLLFFHEVLPVHVVAAVDLDADIGHVITAYRPDLAHFEVDLKTRRVKP
ncbi:MAG: DUF4258 domain-containing protein [Gammaproteobacteria bacterium]|nr:DUF4258 domain-containing protein [Gammaproteobacteria bacterium]